MPIGIGDKSVSIGGCRDYELTALGHGLRNIFMGLWSPDERLNRRRLPVMPTGLRLRQLVVLNCRVWGPTALVWLAVLFANERYGDVLRQRLPGWAYSFGYSVVMIGAVIPFLGMFTWPVAIYAAIKLRREWRLALPCVLFAIFGVLINLAGLAAPSSAVAAFGDMLAWPALGVAAITAIWAGYCRRHAEPLEGDANIGR